MFFVTVCSLYTKDDADLLYFFSSFHSLLPSFLYVSLPLQAAFTPLNPTIPWSDKVWAPLTCAGQNNLKSLWRHEHPDSSGSKHGGEGGVSGDGIAQQYTCSLHLHCRWFPSCVTVCLTVCLWTDKTKTFLIFFCYRTFCNLYLLLSDFHVL